MSESAGSNSSKSNPPRRNFEETFWDLAWKKESRALLIARAQHKQDYALVLASFLTTIAALAFLFFANEKLILLATCAAAIFSWIFWTHALFGLRLLLIVERIESKTPLFSTTSVDFSPKANFTVSSESKAQTMPVQKDVTSDFSI